MTDLYDYGWNEEREQHRARFTPDLVPGRVVAEHRDLYRIQAAMGELSATVAGRLRDRAENRGDLPAVGDWVLLDSGEAGGVAVIREVLPRRSRFSRKVAVVYAACGVPKHVLRFGTPSLGEPIHALRSA